MAHLITSTTSRFHIAKETPNPVNPIAGASVLQWLREKLATRGYEASTPAAKDWGWSIEVHGPGASYLIGASADPGQAAPSEWAIQIHRHRSWSAKLFDRNQLADDDALSACVESLIREGAGAQVYGHCGERRGRLSLPAASGSRSRPCNDSRRRGKMSASTSWR